MSARLEAGDTAPDFTLTDERGQTVSLHDFRGQKVILYFYPEALTEACQKQACDFRDSLARFGAEGYVVLGVSRDDPEKLARAASVDGLGFTLLSDPDRAVHEAYGVWGEKNLYGKLVVGVIRSTFVINENGIVTHPLYSVKATGHVRMLRKKLGLAA